MKVKTEDLIRPALDWAVGTALGLPVEICQIFQYGRPNGQHYISTGETDKDGAEVDFEPSEEWSQGGPIIEQGEIELLKWALDGWAARDTNYQFLNTPQERPCFAEGYGPTPLIAAMRCLVASKLGDEVDIPEELLT